MAVAPAGLPVAAIPAALPWASMRAKLAAPSNLGLGDLKKARCLPTEIEDELMLGLGEEELN